MGAYWPDNAIDIHWSFGQEDARKVTITADEKFSEALTVALHQAGLHAQYSD